MRSMKKKIEDLMSAVSFAEEGEFETAREFLKDERRVLLALMKGQVDRRTFRYAMNTCKRIGAGLDILYVSSTDAPDTAFDECISELGKEGISHRLVQRSGCLKQAIIDYTALKKRSSLRSSSRQRTWRLTARGKAQGFPMHGGISSARW